MKFSRRRFLHLAAAAATLPASMRIAKAQAYPARPITIVVPYAGGGPSDVIARVLVERMRGQLGQPVLVENVVGTGGSIALGRVARASPDGYTVVLGNWGTHVALGAVYQLVGVQPGDQLLESFRRNRLLGDDQCGGVSGGSAGLPAEPRWAAQPPSWHTGNRYILITELPAGPAVVPPINGSLGAVGGRTF